MSCSIQGPICSSAGKGPSCSTDSGVTSGSVECLARVKEDCDKVIKKCLDQCLIDEKNGFVIYGRDDLPFKREEGQFPDKWEANKSSDSSMGDIIEGKFSGIKTLQELAFTDDPDVAPFVTRYQLPQISDDTVAKNKETESTLKPISNDGIFHRNNKSTLFNCQATCYTNPYCDTAQCYCSSLRCTVAKDPDIDNPEDPNNPSPIFDDPKKKTIRKNLKKLQFLTASDFGLNIELILGRVYLSGNIIDISNVSEKTSETIEVKVDPVTGEEITFIIPVNKASISFRVGVCHGTVNNLVNLWINGKKYNNVLFKKGSTTEKISLGKYDHKWGSIPSYRELCYVDVIDLDITTFLSFPILKIEVFKDEVTQYSTDMDATLLSLSNVSSTNSIFTISEGSRRLYVSSGNNVKCINTVNGSVIWDKTIVDNISILPQGKVLTQDSTRFQINDVVINRKIGQHVNTITPSRIFLNRISGSSRTADLNLIYFNSIGNGKRVKIDPITNKFSPYGSVITLPAMPSHMFVCNDSTSYQASFGFLYKFGGDHKISLIINNSNNNDITQTFTFSESYSNEFFKVALFRENTATLTLVSDQFVYSFNFSSTSGLVLNWRVPLVNTLSFNPTQKILGDNFIFFDQGKVFKLGLTSGSLTTLRTTVLPTFAKQFYSEDQQCIFGVGTDDKIYRISCNAETIYSGRVSLLKSLQSLTKELDYSLLQNSTDTLVGYRSGDKETLAEILQELGTIFFLSFSEGQVVPKNIYTPATVNERDSLAYVVQTHRSEKTTKTSGMQLSYFSVESNGDIATQYYVNSEEDRLDYESTSDSFSVLENDKIMKMKAEVIYSRLREDSDSLLLSLTPRNLALKTTDNYLFRNNDYTALTLEIGNDNSINVLSRNASIGIYQDILDLVADKSTSNSGESTEILDYSIPSPFVIGHRALSPASKNSYSSSVGVFDIDQTFLSNTVGYNVSETILSSLPLETFSPSVPVLWGRLTSIPSDIKSSVYTTFWDDFLDVEFTDASSVQLILSYISYPDSPLYDSYANLILVGSEFIQFRQVVNTAGNTLRFSGLYRARWQTEDFTLHSSDEIVIFIHKDSIKNIEIANGLNQSRKALTHKKTAKRRTDASNLTNFLKPLHTTSAFRTYNGSLLSFFIKANNYQTFNFSNQIYLQNQAGYSVKGYILSGNFNKILFDSERETPTTNGYVFKSVTFSLPSSDLSVELSIYFSIDSVQLEQNAVSLVVAENNTFGETLTVFEWGKIRNTNVRTKAVRTDI
jgi:hypothetical protein